MIYHLEKDARRLRAPRIAEVAGVSPSTVRNRIRALEEAAIVRGYHADVDYERIEARVRNLFICTAPIPERERLAQEVLEIPGVVHVRDVMTGHGNVHVTAIGVDTEDLVRIASELSKAGLEIEDENLVRNEYSHPYHPFGPSADEQG